MRQACFNSFFKHTKSSHPCAEKCADTINAVPKGVLKAEHLC